MRTTTTSRPLLILVLLILAVSVGTWWVHRESTSQLAAAFVVSEFKMPPSFERRENLSDKPTINSYAEPARGADGGTNFVGAFLNGSVTNNGRTQLHAVTLRVPGVTYSCERAGTTEWSCQAERQRILIGDLPPHSSWLVRAWLASKPSVPAYNDIRLTHDAGNGVISFKPVDVPPGPVRRHILLLALSGLLAMLALHFYFADRYVTERLAQKGARAAMDQR